MLNEAISMETELMKPQEAADYLCMSRRNLDKLKKEGKVTYSKIGRCVRFRKEDLDALVARGCKEAFTIPS